MNQAAVSTRRDVLWSAGRWLAGAVLFVPVIRFLGFRLPRKTRAVAVQRKIAAGGFHIDPDFVLFVESKSAWAVSRTCTHLGCQLAYSEEDRLLVCPCHRSRFTPSGRRVAGPAQRDLPRFRVEVLGDPDKGGFVVHV